METIKIALAGDVMIGRLVNEVLDTVPPAYIWGDLLPILQAVDLRLINLEAALTKSQKKVPKVFNFKADPEKVQSLQAASIDVVNLANNHSLDFSVEGLIETLQVLDQAGIQHVGAGRNLVEAKKPVIIEKKGIRIGILGCTDNEPEWLATEHRPGTFYLEINGIDPLVGEIQRLRPHVDILIVSIHWGPNMRERPPPHFVHFAHKLIDADVDIVHGHSAHIFQGIEFYRDKMIFYDTGDFIDDYAVDPLLRNDHSFLFIVEADAQGPCSLDLIPVLIANCQVNQAKGKEAQRIKERMQRLSAELTSKSYRDFYKKS